MSPGCCAPGEAHHPAGPASSNTPEKKKEDVLGCDDGDSCCGADDDHHDGDCDSESDCCGRDEKECKGDEEGDDCCKPITGNDDDCESTCCAGSAEDNTDDCCSGDVKVEEKQQVKTVGGCEGCASGEKEACNGSLLSSSPFILAVISFGKLGVEIC